MAEFNCPPCSPGPKNQEDKMTDILPSQRSVTHAGVRRRREINRLKCNIFTWPGPAALGSSRASASFRYRAVSSGLLLLFRGGFGASVAASTAHCCHRIDLSSSDLARTGEHLSIPVDQAASNANYISVQMEHQMDGGRRTPIATERTVRAERGFVQGRHKKQHESGYGTRPLDHTHTHTYAPHPPFRSPRRRRRHRRLGRAIGLFPVSSPSVCHFRAGTR
ncbi:hypothetical protein ZHAS_00021281 [Anopheles sinensis]|uniref:Uncharacterized protein n=1 Tax=Anopheles sinensis TaxID=74873 RepID=A0A084WRZ5_ANOSI|nr:hypothetical protein ZHAS_00021281 [Anopheles sinensis]